MTYNHGAAHLWTSAQLVRDRQEGQGWEWERGRKGRGRGEEGTRERQGWRCEGEVWRRTRERYGGVREVEKDKSKRRMEVWGRGEEGQREREEMEG